MFNIDNLKEKYNGHFNEECKYIFCAPGRSELAGNHTDHQKGIVLAASISLKTYAAVALNNTNIINVYSENYEPFSIDLNDLNKKENEYATSISLVKGICNKFIEYNETIKGFNAYVCSEVLSGSGLSSSAAYEVLFATIINTLFCNNKYSKIDLAIISQYAENNYFGKPCGLMDQMASSVGNIVYIDFKEEKPYVEKIDFDFDSTDYRLIIVDSGASHEDLTDDYASITRDLKEVCAFFNKNYLREVNEDEFYNNLNELRKNVDERKILRAIHVFNENKRVIKQKEALLNNDIEKFLSLVKESGISSYTLLQNIVPQNSTKQELALVLALASNILKDNGVVRVHGGGFAGTIQCFVKKDYAETFIKEIEKYIYVGACHILQIDRQGSCLLEEIK